MKLQQDMSPQHLRVCKAHETGAGNVRSYETTSRGVQRLQDMPPLTTPRKLQGSHKSTMGNALYLHETTRGVMKLLKEMPPQNSYETTRIIKLQRGVKKLLKEMPHIPTNLLRLRNYFFFTEKKTALKK